MTPASRCWIPFHKRPHTHALAILRKHLGAKEVLRREATRKCSLSIVSGGKNQGFLDPAAVFQQTASCPGLGTACGASLSAVLGRVLATPDISLTFHPDPETPVVQPRTRASGRPRGRSGECFQGRLRRLLTCRGELLESITRVPRRDVHSLTTYLCSSSEL